LFTYSKRHVDNIAVAAPTIEIAQEIISIIGRYVKFDGNSILTKFNGLQVDQTRDFIAIHCSQYISTVLLKHGWDTHLYDVSLIKEPIPATMFKKN
jgi:hypothetical protein